jgi:CoA:oxalate CoA-transferase
MQDMEANRQPTGPRVLDDVRVLDFTAVIAGSYCTRMMADLGAEVLKVEGPGGEILRHAGPLRNQASALFSSINCGKRSLSLDLKKPAAIDICKRLVESHDVVVENYSPGVMQRLGLDYESLRAVNPRLVMCSISGYGQTGPEAGRPAYAPIVQATSGFEALYKSTQGDRDRPLNMGPPVADTAAGQQAFGAVMAALYYRERSGIGQYIDIAMQDTLLSTMHKDFQIAMLDDANDRHYGPLQAQDGFVIVVPLNQHHFESLMACIERPDLHEDERFASLSARIVNYDALQSEVEKWTMTQTCEQALTAFEARKLPSARYRSFPDLADDPQLLHRDMLTEVVDEAGPLLVPNSPFLFSHTHAAIGKSVSAIGEHNRVTLSDYLDFSANEIAALEADGTLGPAKST